MRVWPWTKRPCGWPHGRKKVEAVGHTSRMGQLMPVRARFDAAQTAPDNRKHWSNADPLSAVAGVIVTAIRWASTSGTIRLQPGGANL